MSGGDGERPAGSICAIARAPGFLDCEKVAGTSRGLGVNTIAPKLDARLALLSISEETKTHVAALTPVLSAELDPILRRFYRHIRGFPEGQALIPDDEMEKSLRARQRAHWLRLFSCRFDDDYVASALAVGRAHLRAGVAPYIYIAGYNFILCELIKAVVVHHAGALNVSGLLTAMTRVVYLDMDLALSTYTRELWRAQGFARRR